MMSLRSNFPFVWGLSVALALSALVVSCEPSSGLLSASERNSLYTLDINASDGSSLQDGVILAPGSQAIASVTHKSGADDPSSLIFSLGKRDGTQVSSLRFIVPSAETAKGLSESRSTASPSKAVSRIVGKLEGFSIPSDAASGEYELTLSLADTDGSVLQSRKVLVFVDSERPVIDSVSTFPPSVEPGSSVLLDLTVSWAAIASPSDSTGGATSVSANATAKARDPYIRWSKDGTSFAEGLLSGGLDKVVWTAPRADGAYSISAEVFPSAPTRGSSYSFKSPSIQDLKVMVITASDGSGNDFADPLAFYSLLKLDGSFEDSGTRPRTSQPQSFGSPSLDTYASGFGYRFNSKAGVRIAGLMPPANSGALAAFAVLVRLAPDEVLSGTIVRFVSEDDSFALILGLDQGRPYVETQADGRTQRSVGYSEVGRSAQTIEAVLTPVDDKLHISWRAEGERIQAPALPLPSAPHAGSAVIGGEGSLAGVYDGFGFMVPGSAASYPSPAYRLASRRHWRSTLLLAEAFEDGVLPSNSYASGALRLSEEGLVLEPGAALALGASLRINSGLFIEAAAEGDLASCLIAFSVPGAGEAFAVRPTGEVVDAAGTTLGSITASGGRIAFTLAEEEGSLSIVGSDASKMVHIPGPAKNYSLELKREGGTEKAVFSRILVRSVSSSRS
jgi:hypothetical protein